MAPVDLHGKRVTVMGLGRFGGGVGAVRFLVQHGARVTLTDSATAEALAESLAKLEDARPERLRLGGHDERDFTDTDLVVVNPAVPHDHPCLEAARRAGVTLSSEMNLFFQCNRARTVGVTGSNGKSTTTALVHAILTAAGLPARLGGNIGRSLLPEVDEIRPDEWVVLELSSFQLDDLRRIECSPDVAVVTNFSPNHLDRHGTLESYRDAKQGILASQTRDGIAVLNEDDPDVAAWPTHGRRLGFGLHDRRKDGVFARGLTAVWRSGGIEFELPIQDWLRLPGRHNLQNALAATCAALAIGVPVDAVQRGIETYVPLPHRLQFVGEVDGRRFYNDSLATTPESAIVGLEAFDAPVVLLAGGYDKQVDLGEMARAIARHTKAVALLGQTAPKLRELMEAETQHPRMYLSANFRDAFQWSVAQTQPGDVVLLSPGCASYDWFKNFADRGDQFTKLVHDLARAGKTD